MTTSASNAVCFSTAFGLAAHQDAISLQEQGVWLGDYDDEKAAVNGPSYDDVQRDYFFQTDAGKRKGYNEPYCFDEATETTEAYLQCAGCLNGALLKIECHQFEWEDDDSETVMTKNIWTYPGKLGDRKVFALIKQMAQIQEDPPVWGFWKVDGGYTSHLLLAPRTQSSKAGRQTRSPEGQSAPKRGFDTHTSQIDGTKRIKQVHDPDSTRPHCNGGSNDSGSSGDSVVSALPNPWNSINNSALATRAEQHAPSAVSSNTLGKLPLRNIPNWRHQVITRQNLGAEDENLYDSTPRPDRPPPATGFFRQYNATRIIDANAAPQQPDNVTSIAQEHEHEHENGADGRLVQMFQRNASETVQAASPEPQRHDHDPYRFRFFVTVSWSQGQNVVVLDDGMDVQAAYARIQRTMARKLEGKDIACLSFIIPDEEPIDVEVEDSDGWETVVELVKEAGLSAVKGTLSRRE